MIVRGKVDCYGRTDVGLVRETNEDQFLIADLRKSIVIHRSSLGYDDPTEFSGASRAKLFVVADGMGGHEGGQRASWMAVEGVMQYMLTNLHWPITCAVSHEEHFFRGLNAALEFSQEQIRAAAEMHPGIGRMGTTLTMAWVVWPTVYLIHVGDSRAYLFRNGRLHLISHDQTLAQALADNGVIREEEVEKHRFRNVLVSALGCSDNMEPQCGRHELQTDDQLMICTDGVTKHLDETQISNTLREESTAKSACNRLVDAAKDAGGTDNITVVLARFIEHMLTPEEEDTVRLEAQSET